MTVALPDLATLMMLLFCRIGGCVMTTAGFSSPRIPVRARLYIAIAVTLALMPTLSGVAAPLIAGKSAVELVFALLSELLIGVLIGSLARLFFFALETLATAAVMATGLGNLLGAPMEESEPLPSMSTFVMLGATALVFVLDQHLEILRGLHASYSVIPIMVGAHADALLHEYMKVLSQSFLLALRICSPFLLFGLIINLAFGFLNKLSPLVPVYFVSTPLLIALGIYWFYVMADDYFSAFAPAFGSWLQSG